MISRTKLVLLIFALLLTLLAFSFSERPVKIVIDSHTSTSELVALQDDLEEKGYSLEITELSRNHKDEIKAISGEVDFGGNSGTFSTDRLFGKIVITYRKSRDMSIEVNKVF